MESAQWKKSLDIANEVRKRHGALKREIKSLPKDEALALIADVLRHVRDNESPYATMKLADLLKAVHYFGPLRVRQIITIARCNEGKTLGKMTVAQIDLVLSVISPCEAAA